MSAVVPLAVAVLTSAPPPTSASIIGALPLRAAMRSGVYAPLRVVARTFAPAYKSIFASSRSFLLAAQCSAVMPSPCAELTSAPSLSSARTASLLPCMAASTTEVAGVAAWASIERPIANVALAHRLIIRRSMSDPSCTPGPGTRPRQLHCRIQVHRARAVAEALQIGVSETMQQGQQHVGHRRAVGRLDMQVALQRAAGVARQEERHALVIVNVRIAHRRAVQHQGVVEEGALAVARVLQLLEQIRHHAHVVPVDLGE